MSNKKRIEELEATCSMLQGRLHRLEHLCRLHGQEEMPQRLVVSYPPVTPDHPSFSDYVWNRDNAEKLQALWRAKDEVQGQIQDLNVRHTDHLRGYSELAGKAGECVSQMAEHTDQATHLKAEFDELAKTVRENYVKFGPMLGEGQQQLARMEGRMKKLEQAVESAVASKPLSEDKLVGKTTDSPRPLIDGDLSKGILSVWKVKLNNTADPSATLYWRRAAGGTLHLCELGPRPGNITAVETEWAHPCCPADDFPDPGRAKKEQPKAYCGDCLERCLRLLCEGYPNET